MRIRPRHAVASIVMMAVVAASGAAAQEKSPFIGTSGVFFPGRMVVKFKDEADAKKELAVSLRLAVAAGFQKPPTQLASGALVFTLTPRFTPFAVTAAEADADFNARLVQAREDPRIEYVQPVYMLRSFGGAVPNDPLYEQMWHYRNFGSGPDDSLGGINLAKRWAEGDTGTADIVVAVIDTGIVPDHPEFARSSNIGIGFDFITHPFVANDDDGRDSDPTDPGDAVEAGECGFLRPAEISSWHGSHVAGTIGAGKTNDGEGIAGAVWSVTVVPIRVLGRCGGASDDIDAAIRWAAGVPLDGVDDNPNPANVINLSFGAPFPCSDAPETQAAVDDAIKAGAVVVVAAGNSAEDAKNFMPASCKGVITVAASDARGRLVERYSNFGAVVDIMAPGGDILRDDNGDGLKDGVLSAVKPGSKSDLKDPDVPGYARYNGTSMAAPHVTAVIALRLAHDPVLQNRLAGAAAKDRASIVAERLKETAIPRSQAECPGGCGAGLINAVD